MEDKNHPLIVHVVAYYPPHLGGMERVAKNAAESVAKLGRKVLVLTSRIGFLGKKEDCKNMIVKRFWSFEFLRTPFAPGLFWNLFSLPKNSIIHLHLSQAYWAELVLFISKIKGIPYVLHFHLDVQPSGRLGFIFLIYKKIFWGPLMRSAAGIIACSQDQAEFISEKYGAEKEKISVIANAVADDFFLSRKYIPSENGLNLIYVGRLVAQKRVDRIIDAMDLVKSKAHLTIVGDGESRRELEELAAQKKNKNITFAGTKNDKEMQALYAKSDILLISSMREGGTPLVVLEAMAAGVPVIGSNVPGIRDLLNNTGILVNDPFPAEFARAIDALSSRRELLEELSEKGTEKAKGYTWSVFTEKLLKVYQNAREIYTHSFKRFGLVAVSWLLFCLLSVWQINNFQILNIFGFLSLASIPGFLTVRLLGIRKVNFITFVSLIVGFSLLDIILVGLGANWILPLFGILRPLDQVPILSALSVFVLVLGLFDFLFGDKIPLLKNNFRILTNLPDRLAILVPTVFLAMSVAGAIMLNNGGTNVLTFVMLIMVGIYFFLLAIYGKKITPEAVFIGIFFASLSLLLMTSLRGWYITGHDIQREYRVFQLAKTNGNWSIASFRDAYNACMSITILPAIISNLLKVVDPYVYKVFFQILFALVPAMVFGLLRRYFSNAVAIMSVIYFVGFPTFFGDMPFLDRQEIAFLFLTLMFFVIFNEELPAQARKRIFMLLGVGLILSHYTTTYTVIALLAFLIAFRPIVHWLGSLLGKFKLFKNSSFEFFASKLKSIKPDITVTMVIILAAGSFVWSSILTNTASGSLYRVVKETASVIVNNTKDDAQSGDVLYSLFSYKKLDSDELLKAYQAKPVDSARSKEPDAYFDASLYQQYPVKVAEGNSLPITKLGAIAESIGINVPKFNFIFRQASAKLLQLLIIIGFLFMLFFTNIKKRIDNEFLLLAIGSLLFVFSQVVLPVLSVEYGVLRAFQQSIIFLGPFIVVGSMAFLGEAGDRIKITVASCLAVVFLLSSTGVFTQALGGYDPQLHLNNSGTYYDIYYLHESEVAGVSWLTSQFKDRESADYQSDIQSDRYLAAKVRAISGVNILNDIYPGLVRKGAYVFLGFTNVHKQQATISYNGTLVTYTYPLDFLDQNKDLVYSSKDVKIYK